MTGKRILIKISGETLSGDGSSIYDTCVSNKIKACDSSDILIESNSSLQKE